MKKLMIAAAIVCAAALVNAATYDWSFNTTQTIRNGWTAAEGESVVTGSNAGSGLQAYLIAYNAETMNQDTILTAVRGGKTVTAAAGSSLIKTSATDADSKVAKVTWDETAGEKPTINAFMVITNPDADYLYVTTAAEFDGSEHPTVSPIAFATATSRYNRDAAGTKNFGSAGWYSVVPEPTSGLLLLLGVAGLALRRRRA